MAAKRWIVVVEWEGRTDDCEFDADEIQVCADSAASAIAAAKEKWSSTVGAEWPHIRIAKVWILTPGRRHALAS